MAADAPVYAGRTEEARRIVIEVKDRHVVLVHAAIDDYQCEQFGQIGPLRIHARANAQVDSRGRFSLRVGDRAETVIATGTITSERAIGTLRVVGTIATGQRCKSHTLSFRAHSR
jgi:hypothetical protein